MKKRILALALGVSILLGTSPAFAQWEPQNKYEYDHEKYTTSDWSPYVKQYHLTTPAQVERGIKGGEGYQCIYSGATSSQDPNIVLRGYDTMGVWYSHDKGQNWQQAKTCPLFINVITADPDDAMTFYLVAQGSLDHEGGVWKSTDGGVNWEWILPMNHCSSNITPDIAFGKKDPETGIRPLYVGKYGKFGYKSFAADLGDGPEAEAGIWKSLDAGKTWNRIAFYDKYIQQILTNRMDDTVVAILRAELGADNKTVGIKNNVKISYDGGKSWSDYNNGLLAGKQVQTMAINPEDPNQWIASLNNSEYVGEKPHILKSDDAGQTWYDITPQIVWNSDGDLDVNINAIIAEFKWGKKNADGRQILLANLSQTERVNRISYDGGYTWRYLRRNGELESISTGSSTNKPGDEMALEDWWKAAASVSACDPDMILGSSAISFNGGKLHDWANSGISGFAMRCIAWDKDANPLYVGGADVGMLRIVKERNGVKYEGKFKPAEEVRAITHSEVLGLAADPNDEKHAFAVLGGTNAVIAETFDGFDTAQYHTDLTQALLDEYGSASIGMIEYHPLDDNLVITNRFVSEDNGKSWRKSEKYIHAFSPFDSNVFYSMQGNKLAVSFDRGRTWKDMNISTRGIEARSIFADKHEDFVLWVGTHSISGVYIYRIDIKTGKVKVFGEKNGLKLYSKYGYYTQDLDQSPLNPNWLAVSGCDQFGYYNTHFVTFDGGENWYETHEFTNFPHWATPANFFNPERPELWLGSHYGINVIQFDEFEKHVKAVLAGEEKSEDEKTAEDIQNENQQKEDEENNQEDLDEDKKEENPEEDDNYENREDI